MNIQQMARNVGVLMGVFPLSPTIVDAVDAKLEKLRKPLLDVQQKTIKKRQKQLDVTAWARLLAATLAAGAPKAFEAVAENRLQRERFLWAGFAAVELAGAVQISTIESAARRYNLDNEAVHERRRRN